MLLLALPALAADLHLALSVRDFEGCASLGAADDTLYTALVAETDPAIVPSTVPMRAAGCLIELYPQKPELATLLQTWIVDPERQGFAMLVAGRIDLLPVETAVKLAEAAKAGPERVRTRLLTSTRPEVIAVLQSTSDR